MDIPIRENKKKSDQIINNIFISGTIENPLATKVPGQDTSKNGTGNESLLTRKNATPVAILSSQETDSKLKFEENLFNFSALKKLAPPIKDQNSNTILPMNNQNKP